LYAARDTNTGKLVSDITNPKRKYWDKRGNAIKAIDYYNRSYANRKIKYSCNKGEHGTLELVTFELVEVENDGNTLEKRTGTEKIFRKSKSDGNKRTEE
jgi:hypothetical protein